MIKKSQPTLRKSIKKSINVVIVAEINEVIITTFINKCILQSQHFII